MDKRIEDLKEKEIFNIILEYKRWIRNKRNTPKDQIIYDAYYLYSHRDWEY